MRISITITMILLVLGRCHNPTYVLFRGGIWYYSILTVGEQDDLRKGALYPQESFMSITVLTTKDENSLALARERSHICSQGSQEHPLR